MNGIPEIDQSGEDEEEGHEGSDDDKLTKDGVVKETLLCAPYIQIFKNGERIF